MSKLGVYRQDSSPTISFVYPRLSELGLAKETLQKFMAGVAVDGPLNGMFVFPCRNRNDDYVYCGYRLDSAEGGYVIPPELGMDCAIFPYSRMMPREVTLVHNPIEVLLRFQKNPNKYCFCLTSGSLSAAAIRTLLVVFDQTAVEEIRF